MKNECEIVKDLLFSYNDGVVSNSSKELIEEHLKNCTDCNKTFNEIKKENNNKSSVEEIDYLKKIKRNLKIKNIIIRTTLVILCMFILICTVITVKYYNSASKMEIYLSSDISEEQKSNIINLIEINCKNAKVSYNSRQNALDNMKDKLKNKEYLLDGMDNNIFSGSYDVVSSIKEIKNLEKTLKDMPGIKNLYTYIGIKIK